MKNSDVSVQKVKRLQQLENQLAEMQGIYGPEHPEVKEVKREIAILKPEVNKLMTETVKMKISQEKPDNPVYINLTTQIKANQIEMEAIEKDKEKIIQDIDELQRRVDKSPFIEKEYNSLIRDLETTKGRYLDVSNKVMEAKVSKELEGKEQSQRISIASSAYLPSDPFKPNRLLILLLGFVSALVVSSLFVAVREGMDDTIKTTEQIRHLTGIPVLSSVSYIVTDDEKHHRRIRIFLFSLAIILIIGGSMAIVDKFFINLNELTLKFDKVWGIILERIKMIA